MSRYLEIVSLSGAENFTSKQGLESLVVPDRLPLRSARVRGKDVVVFVRGMSELSGDR